MATAALTPEARVLLARQARALEIATIVWAMAEAALSLLSAARQHSVSLAGFGGDSLIEVVSAIAIVWRMSHEMNSERRQRAEHVSLRITGYCLLVLAAYVLWEAVRSLLDREVAHTGAMGIAVTAAALVLMPLLSTAKRRVARALDSRAMLTDAKQTDFCTIQAAIVLGGLALNRWLGVTWTDGVAALILVPILCRAGVLALQGRQCCSHHGADCGHPAVPHGDHVDYLVEGHLYHQENGHCDNHGNVKLVQ